MTLPSDEQLDQAAQEYRARQQEEEQRRREAVRGLMADEKGYDHRLKKRGYREYRFWRRVNGKWTEFTSLNPAHAAGAAVHEGSRKALTTSALPERPTLGWLVTIDQNAARDQRREEVNNHDLNNALLASTIMEEKGRLPAKPKPKYAQHDPDAPPALEPFTGPESRYLPHPEAAPHVPLRVPDYIEGRDWRQAKARAARIIEAIKQAGVPVEALELAVAHYGEAYTFQELADKLGTSRQNVHQRVDGAVGKILALGPGYATIVDELKACRFDDFEESLPTG